MRISRRLSLFAASLSLLAAWTATGAAGLAAPATEAAAQIVQAATPATPAPAWPRTFNKDGNTVLIYQPQIDAWKDHSTIRFRAAVAVTPAGATAPEFGVIAVQGDTYVDDAARTVMIANMKLDSRFPGATDAQAAPLKAAVTDCLSKVPYLSCSLDQVLAYQHNSVKVPTVAVNMEPPPIFFSDMPAILVIFMGTPQFKPIPGTQIMFAVNTNWTVLMDIASSQYYLLNGDSWLTAPDPVAGPWTNAASLPASFGVFPSDGNWAAVKKHMPGTPAKTSTKVIVSTEVAELIMTQGPLEYSPIHGTRLMYVSNPSMPLFLDLIDSHYYYLVSGRWFSSMSVGGPWKAASANLPAEFAKIPVDSPMGFVLASVPGTQEAQDAVLLAQVPHKATIDIATAKVAVTYDGDPKFMPITGTSMTYAANTAYDVVCLNQQYYCCYSGVWFVAPAAAGPYTVCISVPPTIYTIPPSCPLYNCTYVQVYSATPTDVVVGYTGGYTGEYVAATGALMFGAGMVAGALIASNNCWYNCNPCYYSYGCAAHYSYAYGGYYRAGGACYGPCGGAGWGAAYNPSTGTWARGGAAYGPDGAHWGAQAYNPYTNTYAQHTGGTNGYSSWGSSYKSNGSQWAQASHQSTARGSVGEASNSSGQWAEGAHSNATNSSIAKTSNGNTYASHDGNVYKKSDDGSWSKYTGGGNWSDPSYNKPAASPSTSASGWGSSASTSAWKNDFSGSSPSSAWANDTNPGAWGQHNTQSGLNQDSWARGQGNANTGAWGGGGGGSGWGGGSSSGGWGSSSGWGSANRSSSGWGSSGGGWGDRSSGGGWGGGGFGGGGGWGGGGGGFRGGGRR